MAVPPSAAVPSLVLGKEALSKLDSQLTCAVCWDRYTDPRTLPCAHSYCKDCINRLPVELDNGRYIVRCPSCRQATQVGEKGTSSFPTAFVFHNLLEIEKLLKEAPTNRLCQEHENKPKDIYCETCEDHICFKCSTESHRDHQCDRSEDLFPKHKQQIEAALLPLQKQIEMVEETLFRFDIREGEIKQQGEDVQKRIDQTYLQLINQLQETRRNVSHEAYAALQEKLQLHWLQRANVEAILVQLKGCREFVEEKLKSQSHYQIQVARRQLVDRINNTHSDVKVSKFQPAQEPNTTFTADKNILSACGHIGDVTSKQSFSWADLFSVDLPSRVLLDKQTQVLFFSPMSLSASRLRCLLYTPAHSGATEPSVECPVTSVGEGQYKVMIRSSTVGLYQLRVLVDEVDICGSPFEFTVHVPKWKRQNPVKFAKRFSGPTDVAVTNDRKHVVVAEYYGHCVTVLSSNGKVVRKFGGRGNEPGKFENPTCVALSTDAHILVVDQTFRLQKFTLTSALVALCYTGGIGVAVHPTNGKLFCTNHKECKIIVLNADLTPSHSFSSDLFTAPCRLAIDTKGMVYVTDIDCGVVFKFTPQGEHLVTIGHKGEQLHQFSRPLYIFIDSNDIVYVTDGNKRRVLIFTTEGDFLGIFGCAGVPNFNPNGVAVDNTGKLYVCDSVSGEVLVSKLL